MERGNGWMRRLTADIRDNTLPGIPVLELAGDRRVLIECHCGVKSYTNVEIGIRVKYGTVLVRGADLCLTHMSRERLVISGRIDSIALIRRGENAGER